MTFAGSVWRGLLIFVAMFFIQIIAGALVPIKAPAAPHVFEWLLVTNTIIIRSLCVLATRSEWRGWKLGAVLAAIPFVITSLNLLEGTVFLTNSDLQWGRLFVNAIITAALILPVWAILFGGGESVRPEHYHPIQAKDRSERAWKFAVSDLSYLILYYGAGMIIFPYVKSFYATQHLPSAGTIIALQLLIRGPVFVLICIGMARMLGMSRLSGAITVGVLFTVISGVAPLLIPNPYFPDSVRWVHFCEVVSENFVFGAVVAWLWGAPGAVHVRELQQVA